MSIILKKLGVFFIAMVLCAGLAMAAKLGHADAQSAFEDANVTYTYSAPADGEFEDEVEQQEVKASGTVSVLNEAQDGFDLSIGGVFQVNDWSFDDGRLDDLSLYKIKAPITAGFNIDENLHLNVILAPAIYSDLEHVTSDDFYLEGAVVGTYKQHDTLAWVLGFAVGSEFGDPKVFPVFGANWQATDEWLLSLVFPTPKISYALSEDSRLFIAGEPTGGEWNVGDSSVKRDIDIQLRGYRVGAGAEFQVIDGGWLFIMAGKDTNRELQLGVDDREVFDDELEIDDATFVQIGFRVR